MRSNLIINVHPLSQGFYNNYQELNRKNTGLLRYNKGFFSKFIIKDGHLLNVLNVSHFSNVKHLILIKNLIF